MIETGAPGLLVLELDREGVHRHGADDLSPGAVDEHLGPREGPAETVGVPDRHEADPGSALGAKAPAVAGALARRQRLRLRDVAPPGEHRLEAVQRPGSSPNGERP